MTLQELESQLNRLRQKWKGYVPKSNVDPRYWEFRCDACIAKGLKREIEKIKNESDLSQ